MAIQTLHDTGTDYQIPSKYDGGVYQVSTVDAVIGGIGDEFTINYQADSLNVTFNAGSQAVIGGSFFHVTSLEAVTLVPNSTIYLCANIDLSKPNGTRGSFVQRTASNMQSDNLNGSGTSRDLLLYVIQTGANGVVSVSDRRTIRNSGDDKSTATITLQVNGQTQGSFRLDEVENKTINLTITQPTVPFGVGSFVGEYTQSYYASFDCYASCYYVGGNAYWVSVDGQELVPNNHFGEGSEMLIPLKAGSTVSGYNANLHIRVFRTR